MFRQLSIFSLFHFPVNNIKGHCEIKSASQYRNRISWSFENNLFFIEITSKISLCLQYFTKINSYVYDTLKCFIFILKLLYFALLHRNFYVITEVLSNKIYYSIPRAIEYILLIPDIRPKPKQCQGIIIVYIQYMYLVEVCVLGEMFIVFCINLQYTIRPRLFARKI